MSADFRDMKATLRVIFHRWPKLCTGFDVEREIQILKGLLICDKQMIHTFMITINEKLHTIVIYNIFIFLKWPAT